MKRFLIVLFLGITSCFAQHRIILDRNGDFSLYIKDSYKFINAGDTVQLAGKYRSIKLYNIPGTPEKPVIFINKGDVTITGPAAGLAVFSGKNFKILGNGDSSHKYGIHFNSSNNNVYPSHGIQLENSTGVEIANCEIGYVSIGILQNPYTGTPMANCFYHDNYLHDIGQSKLMKKGTAFFMGTMQYPAKSVKNNFKNCRIENNIIANISGNAIQVSNGEFYIKNNSVKTYGLAEINNNTSGIFFGINATGNVMSNVVDSATGSALTIMGCGEIEVANNKFTNLLLSGEKKDIVYINGLPKSDDELSLLKLNFHNNEISGKASGFAINNATENSLTSGSYFTNNFISANFKNPYALNPKDKLKQSTKKAK